MGFVGGDTSAMRRMAHGMNQAGSRLSVLERRLSSRVGSAVWVGPDATAFRGRWAGEHSATMRSASSGLEGAAARLRHYASVQDRISAGD